MAEHVDPFFKTFRERALAWQDPEAPPGSPSGIVMETAYPEGVVMLVVMSAGSIDLLFSGGGGAMGAGRFDGPKQAARELAMAAAQLAPDIPPAFELDLPTHRGLTKIYVMVDGIVRSVVGLEKEFGEGRSMGSPLFHLAHRVIAEIRKIPPQPNPQPEF